ncbi:LysO family transporter [Coprobacter sp.]|uniref:LysO family transporter n=1 Tax=Coprobacter sp. TaxID=1941478 RepID=UPI0025D8DD9B|nr:LysO family transporter [uncultured Coprobacter sp.]
MFSVMGFMLAGIFIGYFLKQQKKLFKIIGKLNMWIIFLLLFSMGLSIGNNKSIIQSLDHFGITAIIIGFAATAGSVLLSIPLYKFLFKRQSDK